MSTTNPVLETALAVHQEATHVTINAAAIDAVVKKLTIEEVNEITNPKAFDEDLHFNDGGPLTAQYLLVVDALNFCFWPEADLEYHHLSKGVKAAVQRDPGCISAESLANISGVQLRDVFFGRARDLPQQEERARLVREVGSVLLQHFGGQACNLVQAAKGSALALVQLVAMYFPGFRDHAVYKGRQVFLYKRAQIFAGDLYGAFQGQGLGAFHDLHQITMFADYRVPVVLNVMGILEYSNHLHHKLQQRQEIASGSEEEVEIRACTIVAVEHLRQAVERRFGARGPQPQPPFDSAGPTVSSQASSDAGKQPEREGEGAGHSVARLSPEGGLQRGVPCAVQLDWWLWHEGEKHRRNHPAHHRTLTIYY